MQNTGIEEYEKEMENWEPCADLAIIRDVQSFYYQEARALDARKYKHWLTLLHPEIDYFVPNRHSVSPDPALREQEAYANVEQELSSGLQAPLRREHFLSLSIRADRAFKVNSWVDNPPPRTRRFVSNIEVLGNSSGALKSYNNVMMSLSRYDDQSFMFSYQREDILSNIDGELKIKSRRVVFGWSVVDAPSAGYFF